MVRRVESERSSGEELSARAVWERECVRGRSCVCDAVEWCRESSVTCCLDMERRRAWREWGETRRRGRNLVVVRCDDVVEESERVEACAREGGVKSAREERWGVVRSAV